VQPSHNKTDYLEPLVFVNPDEFSQSKEEFVVMWLGLANQKKNSFNECKKV
jgi:hypothetical protein